jgi:hypothetical protein
MQGHETNNAPCCNSSNKRHASTCPGPAQEPLYDGLYNKLTGAVHKLCKADQASSNAPPRSPNAMYNTASNHYLRTQHEQAPNETPAGFYVHTSTTAYALHRCQHYLAQHYLAQPCTPTAKLGCKQPKLHLHQHMSPDRYRTHSVWATSALNNLLPLTCNKPATAAATTATANKYDWGTVQAPRALALPSTRSAVPTPAAQPPAVPQHLSYAGSLALCLSLLWLRLRPLLWLRLRALLQLRLRLYCLPLPLS